MILGSKMAQNGLQNCSQDALATGIRKMHQNHANFDFQKPQKSLILLRKITYFEEFEDGKKQKTKQTSMKNRMWFWILILDGF